MTESYDAECPMCIRKRQEKRVNKIELSYRQLEDGTCDVYANIFSFNPDLLQLTAERAKFVQRPAYTQDDDSCVLFNVSYETLKEFATCILDNEYMTQEKLNQLTGSDLINKSLSQQSNQQS